MDFRIRQLQCFLTLSDLLNYGKTARALYMSQPAITFQIKSLEESFNVKLFERDRQQVRLTEAGRDFCKYAQNIMDTVDAAKAHFSRLTTRLRLHVSCGPVGQFVLLPAVIRKLASEYPDFELEVSELTTEQMMSGLSDGKVDALLMMPELPIKDLRFDPILRESMVALVSQLNPIAERELISVQELREIPVIAPRLEDCRFHQPFVREMLASFGIKPKFVESPQACSVQMAYVAADEGVSFSTSSMGQCRFPNVVALPFAEPLPRVTLGLATLNANNSPAMKVFHQVVMQCAAQLLGNRKVAMPRRQMPVHQPAISVMSRREAS